MERKESTAKREGRVGRSWGGIRGVLLLEAAENRRHNDSRESRGGGQIKC